MRVNCCRLVALSSVAIGLVSAVSAAAAADDGIDPHVLYQSRADSVELPELGVVISHTEGTVSIGGDSAGEASNFFVMQEMDALGRVQFVGFAYPAEISRSERSAECS